MRWKVAYQTDIFAFEDAFDVKSSHLCKSLRIETLWGRSRNILESSLFETNMALVYIAGYVARNDNQFKECETKFYYEKYGK